MHSYEDAEKGAPFKEPITQGDTASEDVNGSISNHAVETDARKHSKNPILRLNYYMQKLGGETQGAEWIPESQRYDTDHWNSASMWLGANLVIAAYANGMLGIGVFGLTFWDSILCIIFFNLLGCIPVAALSTFGPPTGLRQQVLSRYWFGSIGAKLCCILNVVACVGWSAVNTIAAANSLYVVTRGVAAANPSGELNPGGLSLTGGILIISFASWVISLFGYRIIHTYERWAWVPNFAVLLVICSRLGMSGAMKVGSWGSGPVEAGAVLSFGSALYGFSAGWGPYASDYTVYRPKNTSKTGLFLWMYVVENISVMIPEIIGAASAATILNTSDTRYAAAYDEASTGGLLWMILVQDSLHGFGQFCIVLFALSTISNNIPNIYTFSMTVQSFGWPFYYLPQYILTLIITGIAIGIAIPGASSFSNFLSSFMDLIAYWISFYFGVVLAEHMFFRRTFDNYRIAPYDNWRKMPLGLAGTFGIGCGIAGFVLGMDVTFYIGVISRHIGPPYGGDIGWLLAFAFGYLGYLVARILEYNFLPDSSYARGTAGAWWRFGRGGGSVEPKTGEITAAPGIEDKIMNGCYLPRLQKHFDAEFENINL